MNILIYTHEFPPFQGGIATSSKMIADILSSENNLMVCCPSYGEKTPLNNEKFTTHRINFIGGKSFKKIRKRLLEILEKSEGNDKASFYCDILLFGISRVDCGPFGPG